MSDWNYQSPTWPASTDECVSLVIKHYIEPAEEYCKKPVGEGEGQRRFTIDSIPGNFRNQLKQEQKDDSIDDDQILETVWECAETLDYYRLQSNNWTR